MNLLALWFLYQFYLIFPFQSILVCISRFTFSYFFFFIFCFVSYHCVIRWAKSTYIHFIDLNRSFELRRKTINEYIHFKKINLSAYYVFYTSCKAMTYRSMITITLSSSWLLLLFTTLYVSKSMFYLFIFSTLHF